MKKSIPAPPLQGKESGKAKNQPVKTQSPPHLAVTIDGRQREIEPEQLANPKYADELRNQCVAAKQPVVFQLDTLLDLDDGERLAALDLVARVDGSRVMVGGETHDDCFGAVLTLAPEPASIEHLRRYKLAALEIAILRYPDALEVACNRLLARMRELGIKGIEVPGLLKDARRIAAALARGAEDAESPTTWRSVREVLADAPVAPDVVVPAGWVITTRGLGRLGVGDAGPGIAAPVLVTERGCDVHRGTETVTLAWHREGRWHERVVDRNIVATARAITELAAYGLPVTSNNSRMLVQFLDEFQAANLEHLPVTSVSHKMGWQGEDGVDGFLCGRTLITDASPIESGGTTRSDVPVSRRRVLFRGADDGDDQLADGFRRGGTYEGWLKAIGPLADHPHALLALYASFVPTLLSILRSPNFVLDYSGPTTTGKTTCLRVSASVWGNPDERSRGAALSTWDGTPTFRERATAVLTHLPFIVDETKHVRHPDEVAKTIYAVVQGRGRGRGSVQGIALQDHCVTVMITSGEQPATSFTQDGGTRPRVLTLWGTPFGGASQAIGRKVRILNRRILAHHGHAGPRFIRYLIDHRTEWRSWRKGYDGMARGERKAFRKNRLRFWTAIISSYALP